MQRLSWRFVRPMSITATAIVATASMFAPAAAQSHRPLRIEIVDIDGKRTTNTEMGLWGGVGDTVAVRAERLPRAQIRFVCVRACPAVLPTEVIDKDTVIWADGSRTTGRVEIKCENNSNDECRVVQDGKPSRPRSAKPTEPVSWNNVAYVALVK